VGDYAYFRRKAANVRLAIHHYATSAREAISFQAEQEADSPSAKEWCGREFMTLGSWYKLI
jgi:hypothetical protein